MLNICRPGFEKGEEADEVECVAESWEECGERRDAGVDGRCARARVGHGLGLGHGNGSSRMWPEDEAGYEQSCRTERRREAWCALAGHEEDGQRRECGGARGGRRGILERGLRRVGGRLRCPSNCCQQWCFKAWRPRDRVQQKEGKGVHGTVSCTTHVSSAGLLSVNTFVSHVSMCYWFCSLSLLAFLLVCIYVSVGVGGGLFFLLFIPFFGGGG